MYYVYADWLDDAIELFCDDNYNSALRFAEQYMLTQLNYDTGFYSLDVVDFEPDYCGDSDCSCHRYKGKSLWRFETSLKLAA